MSSRFWPFVQYMTMYDLGKLDSIARNYALDHSYTGNPIEFNLKNDFVRCGLKRIGYPSGDNAYHGLMELCANLISHGYYPTTDLVCRRVGEFYNYDRLATKEIFKWPLKSRISPKPQSLCSLPNLL